MAKDPAFNFYSNDFDQKTKFFTHEQVGMYIRLLITQHQHGHLTEKQMMYICGRYDEDVFSKFSCDPEGKFFNKRLEVEINKKRAYSESRKNNRNAKKSHKSKTYDSTYVNHMNKHMENENEIENENDIEDKGVQGEKKQNNFEHIGKKSGHRISILAKYAGQRPVVIHDIKEFFNRQNQLDDLQRAGWIDFEGFMRQNPGAVFDDAQHVYNSFRKYSLKPKQENAAVAKAVTQLTNIDRLIDAKFASKAAG